MKTGMVYLVGAGPGDPGLSTQKALESIARADVVVYDRLIDDTLLKMVRPDAELIYVGKASSDHTLPQGQINQLLVQKAQEGKSVVRLKGGDPFVFGRGGEEAQELRKNDIAFEIVPGITSAIAVPAYAGIPVTHRGVASSFAVITGHEDSKKTESSIDWAKIATGVDTLVFLMGLQNLDDIVARLKENGRDGSTPVAVIKDGTRPTQRTVVGTLDDIGANVRNQGITSPAIIVVGEVVRLRSTLRWFDARPLFGKRVLVTRARHQASALSKLLAERGAIPVELPVIDIAAADHDKLDEAVSHLSRYQWVLFTSVNGVTAFFERLAALGKDTRALRGIEVGAIGPATADAVKAHGVTPDFMPDDFTTEGIIAGLALRHVSDLRFLLPRADIADRTLIDALGRLGAVVDEVVAYRTLPAADSAARARQAIAAGEIDVVTFASSSTVTNLLGAAKNTAGLRGARVACIGPRTAAAARRCGLKIDILARESTIPALVDAIEEYFQKEQ
jgi:uroporphyrinogen III methyltransferase/synthase